jgi:hypothetical protein
MLPGKTLVFGPSRSGKTYFSKAFKEMGLQAIDLEKDTDLVKWRDDETGIVIAKPEKADAAWFAHNHFVIKAEELKDFLAAQGDIIVFVHCWNIMDPDILSQFDRLAYMSLSDEELERRLRIIRADHKGDGNPVAMEFFRHRHKERAAQAKQLGITFIDATLSPLEFYSRLCQVAT